MMKINDLLKHRRSFPALPLHLVIYSQLVEYFCEKVVRLLMNYRTHGGKEHANLHGKQPLTLLIPSLHA